MLNEIKMEVPIGSEMFEIILTLTDKLGIGKINYHYEISPLALISGDEEDI